MTQWPFHLTTSHPPLAQISPWDDTPADTPAPSQQPHHMSLSDFKGAIHDRNTGKANDNGLRNGLLILMAILAVIALILHLRQRHKIAGPLDNVSKLGRELGRLVRFPIGTRFLLHWVARSTKTPFASLLLSAALFDKSVSAWARFPTFAIARQWGRARLDSLRSVLFAP